jgi:hypothetical protein
MGLVELEDRQADGVDADEVLRLAAASERAPVVRVDAEVGAGHLVVNQEEALR